MSRKTRKLMWSVPLIAAVAVIGALAAFMTLTPGSLFADDLADAPMNLKVKAADGSAGRTTMVLTWEAPESGAPDMYRIDRSSDNNKWKYLTSVSGDMLTHSDSTIKGSTDPKPTYYRVFAVDSEHGAGAVSTSESATPKKVTTPGQVKPFNAAGSGPEMVNLTWTTPDDGGSEILGYCIRAWPTGTTGTIPAVDATTCTNLFFASGPGGSAGDYRADGNTGANTATGGVIRILPGTSYTHKGLRAGQMWSYEIHALNEHGPSQTASATREATTGAANDPPKPGNLLIRQSAVGEVDLYWTISGDGGQDISAYRIEVTDTANQWPDEDAAVPAASADRTASTALALKDAADTDGPMVAIIIANPAQASAITNYDFRHTGQSAGMLHYRVRVETGSGGSMRSSAYAMGNVTLTDPFAHDDDNPNAPALAADVVGTPSDDSTTDSLTDNDVTPGEVTLIVTRSTLGGSDDYRVDISDDEGVTWTMVHSSTRPINQTEYEHQGLKPDQARHFRIFTKKGSAYGVASNVSRDRSAHAHAPKEVGSLTANADGAGKINVSWTAPTDDGGATIRKYCIVANMINEDKVVQGTEITRDGIRVVDGAVPADDPANCARFSLPEGDSIKLTENSVHDVAASTTSVMFTGLAEKTRWRFEVYALNDATAAGIPANTPDTLKGVAEDSDVEDAKTGSATVPEAPKNLTAELARDTNFTGVGSRGVLVIWNAPADPAGSPIVGYKVERKVNDGEFEEKVSSRSAGMTHWVDTSEPAADEMRYYRVTSINGVGTGTEMATVRIPLAMHTHNAPVLSSIGNQTMTVNDTATVTLSATDADGEDVSFMAMSSDDAVAMVAVSGSTLTITAGSDPGTAMVTVTATDTQGLTDMETFTVTVEAAELGAPTRVMAEIDDSDPGSTSVTITWMDGANADGHEVGLVDLSDYSVAHEQRAPTGMSHTFTNVASGRYMAIVVSTLDTDFEYAVDIITVP